MVHKRRVSQDACACDGKAKVFVCNACYRALRGKKPKLTVHMMASGVCLGRHPKISGQAPLAHRLMLPTARVISQRVRFGQAGM